MKEASEMERNDEVEATVVRALEQKPVVRVPESFAARVAAMAVVQPVAPAKARRRVSVGRLMAIVAMVVLAVVLFAVAPLAGTRVTSWPFVVEMVVLVQMAAIGYGVMRLERL
jgi:hypothetical protein